MRAVLAMLGMLASSTCMAQRVHSHTNDVRHVPVYAVKGRFGGWPDADGHQAEADDEEEGVSFVILKRSKEEEPSPKPPSHHRVSCCQEGRVDGTHPHCPRLTSLVYVRQQRVPVLVVVVTRMDSETD